MSSFEARSSGSARIEASGYRRYDGERRGQAGAIFSLWKHTVQRILGLRRTARHKILPFLSIIIAYLPAVAFIGVLALVPKSKDFTPKDFVPTYGQYFSYVTAAIILFVVFAAPEALCPDRRQRSLSLYLASPLNRDTYLLAKLAAIFSVLCLVTVGPLLLLLVGYVLQGNGPDGPVGVLAVLVRILGAGVAVSIFYTAFALAMSSLTDRRGLATGGTLIVLLGTHAVAGTLAFGLGLSKSTGMLSLLIGPFELASRIFGVHGRGLALAGVPTATVAIACLAWTAGSALFVWSRYTSIQVTR